MTKTAEAAATEASSMIIAYKGFEPGYVCREHAFEVGVEYTVEGDIVACENGFHACEYPLAVFSHYPPFSSVFAQVELSGDIDREDDKVAARTIKVLRKLSLADMITEAVRITTQAAVVEEGATASGTRGAATASGNWAIAAAFGIDGRAMADESGAIVLAERIEHWGHDDHGKLLAVWAGMVGQDGIKPNTFYTLKDGKPVEVTDFVGSDE